MCTIFLFLKKLSFVIADVLFRISVTEVPTEIQQNGVVDVISESSVCDNVTQLNDVSSIITHQLRNKLSALINSLELNLLKVMHVDVNITKMTTYKLF